jgi:hypothetical protein
MPEGQKTAVEVVWQQVSTVERYSSPLYPINIPRLLAQLPLVGYIVPDLVLRGTPEQGKPIAMKGDTELVINTDNKTLGVKDKDPESTVNAFRELRKFCLERLDPPPLAVQYVEFDGAGWIKSKDNPLKVFSSMWHESKALQKLGSIIGEETTNYGVEIVPKDTDPNNAKWFHISIQPYPPSGTKEYIVRWIWREPDSERFLKKSAKCTETLRTMISTIENK